LSVGDVNMDLDGHVLFLSHFVRYLICFMESINLLAASRFLAT
jgi:hypothetical protein